MYNGIIMKHSVTLRSSPDETSVVRSRKSPSSMQSIFASSRGKNLQKLFQ